MKGFHKVYLCLAMALGLASGAAFAGEHGDGEHGSASGEVCTGFGPQTPRDIDNAAGENPRAF